MRVDESSGPSYLLNNLGFEDLSTFLGIANGLSLKDTWAFEIVTLIVVSFYCTVPVYYALLMH